MIEFQKDLGTSKIFIISQGVEISIDKGKFL